ncbi:MAG: CHAT domain-containing protein [Chitinophagaceae bacterium]|nr:MAG: CHAT domain-containing protein [Chitinophagaceae bacterium]
MPLSYRTILLLLAITRATIFPGSAQTVFTEPALHELFKKADHYFNLPQPTDASDNLAIELYQRVIDGSRTLSSASITRVVFQSHVRKAILLDVQSDYSASRASYLRAFQIQQSMPGIPDSLAFPLFVNLGATYYQLNHFDSARYFLGRAEMIASASKAVNDHARLYNTFGVLYYDNGNYRQSKNYFTRALALIRSENPGYTAAAIDIETNIATAEYKMGDFGASLERNQRMLPHASQSQFIWLNIGRTNNGLGRYDQALSAFAHIDPARVPGVYNEQGLAYILKGEFDSAGVFLEKLRGHQAKKRVNPLDAAINHLYTAMLFQQTGEHVEALSSLQKAIIAFSNDFSSGNVLENPTTFTRSFAYFRLFEALHLKANLLESVYLRKNEPLYLKAAFETYQLTIEFLSHIEKNYDTDDARLFLKQRSRNVYEEAVAVSVKLASLFPGEKYLESAFIIAESNKGSVLAANLSQLNITGKQTGAVAQKIRNLKFSIARLNVQLDKAKEEHLQELTQLRSNYEIELARASRMLEENDVYYRLKYSTIYPGVQQLQQTLDKNDGVISYFIAKKELYIFLITNDGFHCINAGEVSGLHRDIKIWVEALHKTESGLRFMGAEAGDLLYKKLVMPVRAKLKTKKHWIIIPDGDICQLPFESLPADGNSASLLKSVAISYQFSSRFIKQMVKPPASPYSVAAYAPFADEPAGGWNKLPFSKQEIADITGLQFVGASATRSSFLETINDHPVLHLATHATADTSDPTAAFIAFYPGAGDSLEGRLYLEELYGLKMNKTSLVILSACETGKGALMANEGAMSIARGFAYAGSAASVNSLWRADDKSTAYILQRFHYYLLRGESKPVALQQAKLDYYNTSDGAMSPNYWAHLIVIGDPSPLYASPPANTWVRIIAGGCLVCVVCALMMAKKGRHKISVT